MAWLVFIIVASAVIVGALVLFTALIAALVEGAVPPLGKTMVVDGATFRYLDEGSGPTIVLVHGLAGNLRHFTYALKDRLTADYRVILFDRPGCGYSKMAAGASPRLPAQAATIVAFMRALGLEKPLLVGHSLGGALSLAVALDHPEAIGGLALVAPLTHARDDVPSVFRLLATGSPLRRRLTAWLLATPASMLAGSTTLKMLFGPDAAPADFGKNGGGLLTVRPNAFIAASAEMVAVLEDLPTMAARYASIKCPVGVLHGTGDRILDFREQGEAVAKKIPGATIEMIADAGHMPPLVLPERTAAFIKDVASRVYPTRS